MKARILGLGQWFPETIRSNDAWPASFATLSLASSDRELLDVVPDRATADDLIALRHFQLEARDPFLGTKRRRVADSTDTAPQAEAQAARRALDDAGLRAEEVDTLLSWAAVPERITPCSAPKVAHLLGAQRCLAFGIESACASVIMQLQVAAALIESGRARKVLLTQSHLITESFSMLRPASPNIGDAATAMVLGPDERPGVVEIAGQTHGEYYDSVTWRRGKADPSWWKAGPATYLGTLNPTQAHDLVLSSVRIAAQTVRELMTQARLTVSDIDLLCSVQPRRWLPEAIVEALGCSAPAPQTFEEYAHLGGCGVVVNLIRGRELGLLGPGKKVVLYAQGAGFTRSAALVVW
jgi:3-oxoacyl-[acyl-carrier-protein] synthase-3